MARRKLTITSSETKASGIDKHGKPWTLYEVGAVDEAGEPVDAKLKTFAEPKIGQLIEYEIERQEDERFGVSFLLATPGRGRGGSALKDSVDELRRRVDALEAQVAELQGGPRAPEGPAEPVARSQSAATGPDVGAAPAGHPEPEYQF